ncbi:zinc finger protein [Trichinella spiralis]|uniref:zinc finger protein n=1 Tax=Trichinella spiralis TaxID=6334 RepID=UPI0001EFE8C6|nr:zinc finger protein [Trichinella spiralis]
MTGFLEKNTATVSSAPPTERLYSRSLSSSGSQPGGHAPLWGPTYLCVTGFSALMAFHMQHRSKLNIESDLQCILSPNSPRIYNIVANSIKCFTVETRLA